MEQSFILVLVGLTSVGAYLVGVKRLGLSRTGLRTAVGRTLECMGLALGFFVVNLAVGMTIVLVGRLLTREFVSLYYANDVSLLVLSVLQGLTFLWWRQA
jgi:hypothetical protein